MNSQLFASTFSDREALQPPPPAGMLRAVLLAVAAHLLLLLALTHGLQWKRETQNVSAEAELWSRVPQEAVSRVASAAASGISNRRAFSTRSVDSACPHQNT